MNYINSFGTKDFVLNGQFERSYCEKYNSNGTKFYITRINEEHALIEQTEVLI